MTDPKGPARYLGFRVDAQYYAVALNRVREIVRLLPVTEVPRAGGDVLGVVSVHGQVTTLLDLRRRLGAPSAPTTARARILLVAAGEEDLGLLVDEVTQVYRLADAQIERGAALAGSYAPYIAGVARPWIAQSDAMAPAVPAPSSRADDLLIVLDLAALLG